MIIKNNSGMNNYCLLVKEKGGSLCTIFTLCIDANCIDFNLDFIQDNYNYW